MPNDCLKCFGMGGDRFGIDGGHDHACVRDFRGITAVATDYPVDTRAGLASKAKRLDEIVTDVAFSVATADRKYQDRISSAAAC